MAAGSGDVNLKRLEISAIRDSIGNPSNVLDAGCNGITLMELASCMPSCNFVGFDYSEGMVNAGADLIKENSLSQQISLCRASLLDSFPACLSTLDIPSSGLDVIYTERSLINLDTLEQQCQAVRSLWSMVRSGGYLILCEAFMTV